MGLVNDVDLGARFGARRVHRPLAQVARVVHAAVRRGVELDDVEIRRAGPDAPAGAALPTGVAGISGLAALAVQGHRQNPCRRGLPHPAGAREQIPVGHPILGHGAAQRGGHVILGDQIGELLGAVLAG